MAKRSEKKGSIASTATGRIGVVAAWSRYVSTPSRYRSPRMQGYDASSYGDAFADVYDDWYEGISDVDLTVVELLDLAGSGPVLELGVGTGRIAVPLAEAGLAIGVTVVGIDASEAMLARLAWRDPGGLVTPIHGDMRSDLPDGPFGLVFAAYNTLFNLTDDGAQAALLRGCRRSAAARWPVRDRGLRAGRPAAAR